MQVASGMQALAAAKLVHRDLATRNVLVFGYSNGDATLTLVKVADFGLTVNAYTATYKVVEGGPKPTRWLSPEALQRDKYSELSDVWAFGVFCWEVLTDATIPYRGLGLIKSADDDVIAYVTGGGRLPRPQGSPGALWSLMKSCWADARKDRPTFAQVVATLSVSGGVGQHAEVQGQPQQGQADDAEREVERLRQQLEEGRLQEEAARQERARKEDAKRRAEQLRLQIAAQEKRRAEEAQRERQQVSMLCLGGMRREREHAREREMEDARCACRSVVRPERDAMAQQLQQKSTRARGAGHCQVDAASLGAPGSCFWFGAN